MGRNFPRKSFDALLSVNHRQSAKTSGSPLGLSARSFVRKSNQPLGVSFVFEQREIALGKATRKQSRSLGGFAAENMYITMWERGREPPLIFKLASRVLRHTIAVSTDAKNTDAKNEAIEYSYGKKRKIDCAVATGDVPIQYRSRLMPRARTPLRINVVVEPLLRMSQTKKYRQTRTAKRNGGNVSFDRDTHASCAATTPSLNASNNSNGSHLRYHKIDSSTREK